MTAILSQMNDCHYSAYIETFTRTSDLVVSAFRKHGLDLTNLKKINHWFSLDPLTAGFLDGVLSTVQRPDWETCVPF